MLKYIYLANGWRPAVTGALDVNPGSFLLFENGTIMKDLSYRDTDYLINMLREQNLVINDEVSAKEALEQFGYSNLIKSYRDPYVYTNQDGRKVYRDGVTFEQICSLYVLDKNLRNAVMSAMLDFEEHIKVFAAHTVASTFGSHQDEYLKFSNYRDRKTKKKQFTLQAILEKMTNTLSTDKDPIHHYYSKYGCVPPWILFKSVYFSTIINFVDLFKPSERDQMVSYLYGEDCNIASDELRSIMLDTMFIANEYRNLAAHGGRLYDHKCQYTPRSTGDFGYRLSASNGLGGLMLALSLLKNQEPFLVLTEVINDEINRHCINYPQDVTYLGEILQINIKNVSYVFVSETSHKYHSDPHCSGMQNPVRMEKEDAINQGYLPCRKCAKY